MRRLLSTVYRLFLTVASISALVLSILAATSCDFLDFVHPYKANGRLVLKDRQLEDAMLDSVATSFADVGDTTTPTTVGLVNTDYLAQLADSISQAGNLTDGNETLDDEALAQAAGVIAAVTNGTVDASSSAEAGSSTETQSTSAASSNETTASNTTDSITDTSVSGRDPSSSTVSSGTEETSNKTMTSNTTAGKTSASNNTATSNTTTANKTNDSIPNIPSNAYGLNKSDIPSVAMSGSAGLFCAANDVSIYDIWKGTFLDSELALDEESDHDESEDIARNGAVVSITFGVLVAFIFVVETIFGFRMCLEKWIVSLLAICACVSQGVTFLFFNSERYW
jgi:cobalamin biosynthesis Mg chelatase CobN